MGTPPSDHHTEVSPIILDEITPSSGPRKPPGDAPDHQRRYPQQRRYAEGIATHHAALGGGTAGIKERLLAQRARPRQDRKSTRLNSSHSSISYAVFCLKK